MYLSSDKVKVFPIANRANNTLSEENVTFMNKSMYYGDGFTHSVDADESNINCIFNILGYTFEVNIPSSSVRSWNDIYAGIKLTNNMIAGQDSGDVYEGLSIAGSKEDLSSGGYTYLKIATKSSGGTWKMPGNVITVGNILRIDGKR